jgi:major membrane immunogen (membrane-anchored lipoprotein)
MSLKKGIGLLMIMTCMVWLTSCGGNTASYSDGTYEGQSSVYDEEDGASYGNGYGVVDITISGGVITECTFETYEPDGTLKAEDYGMEGGKISNRDYYNMAQKAVAACKKYAEQLVKGGSVKEVDAISGATVNYDLFREAAEDALKQAGSK